MFDTLAPAGSLVVTWIPWSGAVWALLIVLKVMVPDFCCRTLVLPPPPPQPVSTRINKNELASVGAIRFMVLSLSTSPLNPDCFLKNHNGIIETNLPIGYRNMVHKRSHIAEEQLFEGRGRSHSD